MEFALQEQTEGRRLVAGWLLLALTALALSTLCAVLLVAARAPLPGGLAGAGELFGRALALHVTLAVLVWFLSCAAGFWMLAADAPAGGWRWAAVGLSGTGLAAMVIPLFSGSALPVLANYVPVLDHPLFFAGLVLFVAGVTLAGAAAIDGIVRKLKDGQAWRLGALLSMVAAAFALAAFIASIAMAGIPASVEGFETVAWGPGHLLQFVHVLLLMSVWVVLGERVLGEPVASQRGLAALFMLAAAPILATPFIYFSTVVGSEEFHRAFTLLMAWGCWPAAALLAVRLLVGMARARNTATPAPEKTALVLSISLFLLGCVLGTLIRGDSTMVPAHYHGTVGAVTLAYMALGYRLLPASGAASGDALVRWQPVLYGAGLIVLALALAWSGWHGVPRKTQHADAMLQYPAYFVAMALVALGGLLAIVGAALYVINIVRHLRMALPRATASGTKRDVRTAALLWTLGLTVFTGLMFAYWPREFGTVVSGAEKAGDYSAHMVSKRKEEIDREFKEGVRLLAAKQYQSAASALHRVMELAPQMPEAHVNMGFAMIGMGKHEMARDFFEAAISLRTEQMNAYYGLAVALEGVGDIEGAIGAMRAYVHQSDPEDPFVRKANAAIWEWQEQIAKTRNAAPANADNPQQTAAIPESRKDGIRYPITEKKFN